MEAVEIGSLRFTYHPTAGFIDVEIVGDEEDPVGTFEMDDDTWRNFHSAAQLPPERRSEGKFICAFTEKEARGIAFASIFGTPDPTPPEVASARAKLRVSLDSNGGESGF